MKKFSVLAALIALLCLGNLAQAVTIDTVTIGDAGNAADTRVMDDGTTGYGSVGYNYNIGKYEVTAGQYTAFLNAVASVSDTYGLYDASMWSDTTYGCRIQQTSVSGGYSYSVASDYANRPVNYVSFWDSLRFANWLGNGQGSGGMETGAYTLGGYNGTDGRTIQRNAGATWAVTSEDEWYKAAYYNGGVYSLYANGTDTAPVAGTDSNYNGAIGSTWDGSTYGSLEQNGTKDMMGNVWEWNEAIVFQGSDYALHAPGGGSFSDGSSTLRAVSRHYNGDPYVDHYGIGFRVSQVPAVPEPSSFIALGSGILALAGMIRRRR